MTAVEPKQVGAEPPALAIRRATAADAGLVLRLISELAADEGLSGQMRASEADYRAALHEGSPVAVRLAFWSGAPAGVIVWFQNFSTFEGRPGLFVEDVFVRPAFRRRGVATALLAQAARHARESGLTRVEWKLLNWNEPAIAFFRSLHVETAADWRFGRVSGEPLAEWLEAPRARGPDGPSSPCMRGPSAA